MIGTHIALNFLRSLIGCFIRVNVRFGSLAFELVDHLVYSGWFFFLHTSCFFPGFYTSGRIGQKNNHQLSHIRYRKSIGHVAPINNQ